MKNKIFFRSIAMALIIIMCLGIVACDKSKKKETETTDTSVETTLGAVDSSAATTAADTSADTTDASSNGENSSNGGSSSVVQTSDEETLFAELLKAAAASIDYKGAITMDFLQSQSEKENSEEYSIDMSGVMSIDPDKNMCYAVIDTARPGYGSYKSYEKIFEKDGVLYEYSKSYAPEGDSTGEESIDLESVSDDDMLVETYETQMDMIEAFIGGVTKADSYVALKSAYSKVFSEVKEKELAGFKEMGGFTDATVFTFEPETSIKVENGEIVLTIISRSTISDLADSAEGDGELIDDYGCVIIRKIACKDGKISALNVSADMKATIVDLSAGAANDESTLSVELGYVMDYKFNYAFDQAGFDAIEVKEPTDGGEETSYPIVYIQFEDSLKLWTYFDEGKTVEQFYNETVLPEIRFDYGAHHTTDASGEWVEIPVIQINGLYKDKELTQKIDLSTATRDEILALGTLYADYTLLSEYAIVVEQYSTEYDYSLDYQIVMYDYYGAYNEVGEKEGQVVYVENTPFMFDAGGNFIKTLVNGTEVSGETIDLAGGKVYIIDYVKVFTDAEFDASDLFSDLFIG